MKERPEGKEEQVDNDQDDAEHHDVFLGFRQRSATEVFLHHILVESSHDDRDQGAAQELFPEELGVLPIPEENFGVGALADVSDKLRQGIIELAADGPNREENPQQKEE